jgi:hypothetical protein
MYALGLKCLEQQFFLQLFLSYSLDRIPRLNPHLVANPKVNLMQAKL